MSVQIATQDNPEDYLVTPEVEGAGEFTAKIRDEAGIIIGGFDQVVSFFTGFSPLEEWVLKPFAGDWGALDRGAAAWANAAKAGDAIATNIAGVPAQVAEHWEGEAAFEFGEAQGKLAAEFEPLSRALDGMSQMCTGLADMARAIAELVVTLLREIVDWAIWFLAMQAAPVVGQAASVAWTTKLFHIIAKGVPKITKSTMDYVALVAMIIEIVKVIIDIVSTLVGMVQRLGSGARGFTAGHAQVMVATG